ncbi:IpaD/SipD/SspD family type III secretion system needle tip protein [Pseudomonas asplenii]|uniref:IpaD/SipD/SspD family type III secretion system needle tip protein n=1 Tax=Pseudomonas asplenii TaxID=53407 RepID=UPI00235FFBB7|nr:IpaD/SipD/SspD family type III secretion system needle tip protein [Pseudomonas asplenii]
MPKPKVEVPSPRPASKEPLDIALNEVLAQLQRLPKVAQAGGDSLTYAEQALESRLKKFEGLVAGMIEGRDDVVLRQWSIVDELGDGIRAPGEKSLPQAPTFFDKLIELINLIGERYLNIYKGIVDKFSAFFDAFNSQITSKLQQWMEAVNEGKDIELDVGELKKALEALLAELDDELFKGSKEDAAKWCEALGLPASCLRDNGDGTWSVLIDRSPLTQMLDDLGAFKLDGNGKVVLDSASFQAWQTGFNAQTERLKNKLQELTQKYSSANTTYDNFIKVLSNHINQFTEMLKAMTHT